MWQRPDYLPFPTTWRLYVGRRALAEDGRVPHFRIQDCPVELFNDVIDHMSTIFLRDELLCDSAHFTDDEVSVKEFQAFWWKYLNQRMALVALHVMDDGTTRLAGVNLTMVSTINDEDKLKEFKGLAMRKKRGGAEYVKRQVDIFSRFGVKEYLATLGLSVAPEYRGQGLSLELLQARIPLCRSVGLRITCSIFTAEKSQRIARKAGFKLIYELPYNEYLVDGTVVFPNVQGNSYQCMALEIE